MQPPILICKPCQGTKTAEILRLIETDVEDRIHIVLSDNFCVQADQTFKRVSGGLSDMGFGFDRTENSVENREAATQLPPKARSTGGFVSKGDKVLALPRPVCKANCPLLSEAAVPSSTVLLHSKSSTYSVMRDASDIVARIRARGGTRKLVTLVNPVCMRRIKSVLSILLADSKREWGVNIYLDEADKTYKLFSDIVGDLSIKNPDNIQVYYITATPGNLFDYIGGRMQLHANHYPLRDYALLRDMQWTHVEALPEISVEEQLDAMVAAAWQPGTIPTDAFIFAPARYAMSTHDDVARTMSSKYGVATLSVNSDGFKFWAANIRGTAVTGALGTTMRFEPQMERRQRLCRRAAACCGNTMCTRCFPNIHLIDIIRHFRRMCTGTPFCLTGNACIGRAVTVHAPDLFITHSMLCRKLVGGTKSDCGDSDLYQLVARPSGSFLRPEGNRVSVLTTDKHLKETVLLAEMRAERAAGMGNIMMTKLSWKELVASESGCSQEQRDAKRKRLGTNGLILRYCSEHPGDMFTSNDLNKKLVSEYPEAIDIKRIRQERGQKGSIVFQATLDQFVRAGVIECLGQHINPETKKEAKFYRAVKLCT